MKTWMFVVLILVFVFVVVPLIYFGITAKAVKSISNTVMDKPSNGYNGESLIALNNKI